MDVREKLVELLGSVQQMGVIYRENQMDERYPTIEQIRNTEVAARLIANGVTVQERIVDAVEVVRCRDCKHRGTDYCIFHIKGEPADEELLRKLDNDFCSYGERKDGDRNG